MARAALLAAHTAVPRGAAAGRLAGGAAALLRRAQLARAHAHAAAALRARPAASLNGYTLCSCLWLYFDICSGNCFPIAIKSTIIERY